MKTFNRELSWLSFNNRVLQEAQDKTVPLFERIKFLAIFSSNLEEFFRVRVASLRSLLRLNKKSQRDLDFEPDELLKEIHNKVDELQREFGFTFREDILPELNNNNIFLKREDELNPDEKNFIKEFFFERVYPNINPMILVRKKIKPFLKTGILYLSVKLTTKNDNKNSKKKNIRYKYALVEIPTDKISRFIVLPSLHTETNIIFLDDVVRFCLSDIFKGYNIEEARSFKLTRDAELYIDDEFSGNLLEKIKKGISKRATGTPSKFLYDEKISKDFLKFLREALSLLKEDLIPGARYHNFNDFFNFPHPFRNELQYEPLKTLRNKELSSSTNLFDAIKTKDFLLHFPYQSYDQVIKFFELASEDPNVTEIKITLYRVTKNSSIVNSLLNALKNGKIVTIFIEIKARFDEELNIEFAKELENAGAKILYSIPGLKVHAKLGLITRNENGILKNYCYLATGNFNEKTAKVYSDIGFLTSDSRITNDVISLFDFFTGKVDKPKFKTLLVSQFNMKKCFIKFIDEEIENAKKDRKASITLKLNSLEDKKMIEKLYEANKVGVKINIIVRGVCCLIPGIKGLSENINAISIVDRFLEHSRISIFHNNGNENIFLSSADWMKRNLNRRIEVAFPIFDEGLKKEINELIEIQLRDNTKARIIDRHQINKYKKEDSVKKFISQSDTYEYLKNI